MFHCAKAAKRFFSCDFGRNRSFDLENSEKFDWPEPVPDASEGWQEFGTLKQLIFYPIDCGRGYKFKIGVCAKDGIEIIATNDVKTSATVKDRTFVVCKKPEDEVTLSPEETLVSKSDNGASENALISLSFNDTLDCIQLCRNVKYMGTQIPIFYRFPFGWHHVIYSIPLKDKNYLQYDLGYFTKTNRQTLIKKRRYNPEHGLCHGDAVYGCLPNFSNYTLVNTRSYDAINWASKTYKYFRPQIIVQGKPGTEFLEDKVESVRIGNVIFGQVLPCVIPNVNYNPDTKKKLTFEEVYDYLMKNRLLHEKYPHLAKESEVPVFGINMEVENYCIEEEVEDCAAARGSSDAPESSFRKNLIKRGYKVYVKLRNNS